MNRWASNDSITEQAVRNILWFNCMRTEFNVSSCCCFRISHEILSNLIEPQRYIRCITSLWWKVETWKILFQQTQLRLSSIGGFRFRPESIFGRIPASPKLWLYLAQLNIAAVQHHWRFSHSWRNCTPYWHVLKSMNDKQGNNQIEELFQWLFWLHRSHLVMLHKPLCVLVGRLNLIKTSSSRFWRKTLDLI